LDAAEAGELESIPNQPNLWAELRWAARHEQVRHLDDLLLRRVRMGLLQPKGAADLLPKVRSIVQRELDWDDVRWQAEEKRYLRIWQKYYAAEQINTWR
jgi:glycerol-3-phosphate dehydrogenase